MNGSELIAAERQRQIDKEGWTPKHDDDIHNTGELTKAALAYLSAGISPWLYGPHAAHRIHPDWPWEVQWWKPSSDPIRNLVKAGALIAAEIDRLQRAAALEETP